MISVSASAIASLMRTGMLVSPNPGNSITIAPMRANTSMKAAASAGSNEISMRMGEECLEGMDAAFSLTLILRSGLLAASRRMATSARGHPSRRAQERAPQDEGGVLGREEN